MSSLRVEAVSDYRMEGDLVGRSRQNPGTLHLGANLDGLSWLALAGDPAIKPGTWDWSLVHQAIQDILGLLTERVLEAVPQAHWKPGQTATRAFPLFSYRVFYRLGGDDYDPVVAGVTVTVDKEVARISGDISGDETGRIYFDEGCTVDVPLHLEEILRGARRVAKRLADEARVVVEAIRCDSPESSQG
jgi:hypothetical protein